MRTFTSKKSIMKGLPLRDGSNTQVAIPERNKYTARKTIVVKDSQQEDAADENANNVRFRPMPPPSEDTVEAKIIVLGDPGSGKSSFLKSFLDEIGAFVETKNVPALDSVVMSIGCRTNVGLVKLNIWRHCGPKVRNTTCDFELVPTLFG